jgi:hypothetical protein
MGYLHVQNLYRPEAQRILEFKWVYALEKVHGTSAHVAWDASKVTSPGTGGLTFFSGGVSHAMFCSLFDRKKLHDAFEATGEQKVTVYGEAYGGTCQKMAHVYGDRLQFIVFDVQIGDSWLPVPEMDKFATSLGFEVVPWEKVETDEDKLAELRDRPSEVSVRRGCGTMGKKTGNLREGIVLRPPFECYMNGGERCIAKHKNEKFSETATPRKIVPADQLTVLADAEAIANEWVTEMRLDHVLDKLPHATELKHTGDVVRAMIEDVYREAKGEITESKAAQGAISKKTSAMFKARVTKTS